MRDRQRVVHLALECHVVTKKNYTCTGFHLLKYILLHFRFKKLLYFYLLLIINKG